MADERPLVTVRGHDFVQWEELLIRRSVLAAAAGLELKVGPVSPWPFTPPAKVEVSWYGMPMLLGWIDENELAIEEESDQRTVSGRDVTGDLVDCSPDPDGPFEWLDSDLHAIARDIAAYFGIGVRVPDEDTGEAFPKFSVNPGERAWAAIERGLRMRGLLAWSPGDGTLLITKPSTTRVSPDLTYGYNIKRATVHLSTAERFSSYVVRGQRPGSDTDFGLPITQAEGRATDESLGRPRPHVIVGDAAQDDATAALQAQWEAAVRAAKAQSIDVVVRDWAKYREHDGRPGPLWLPNEVVRVIIPRYSVNSDWYVSAVAYRETKGAGGGKTTTLELVRPGAYTPSPVIEKEGDPLQELFDESESIGGGS